MSKREDTFVIVDISPDWIKAGSGVGEVIGRPRLVNIHTKGRPLPSTLTVADYLVGSALEESLKSEEDVVLVYPLRDSSEGNAPTNGNTAMDVDDVKPRLTKRRRTEAVSDWLAMEALLRHALFVGLGLPSRPLAYHILFAIPPCLPYSIHEQFMQLFFEKLHLSAIMLVDRTVAQTYACGQITALVVEVLENSIEVGVVHNNLLVTQSKLASPVGSNDCDLYLAHLLLEQNHQLSATLGNDPTTLQSALLKMVRWLKDNEAIQFQSTLLGLKLDEETPEQEKDETGEEVMADVAKALAAGNVKKVLADKKAAKDSKTAPTTASTVNVPHPLQPSLAPISVGPERHRWAEPIFDPSLLAKVRIGGDSVFSATQLEEKSARCVDICVEAIRATNLTRTTSAMLNHAQSAAALPAPWDSGIVVTGQASLIQGVPSAMIQALSHVLVDNDDPKPTLERRQTPTLVSIPEYFSEMKDRSDLSAYLGGCIMAKIGFGDAKAFYTKIDYNNDGPSIIRLALEKEDR